MSALTSTPALSSRGPEVKFSAMASPSSTRHKQPQDVGAEDELHVQLSLRGERMLGGALLIAVVLITTMAVLYYGVVLFTFENGLDEKLRKDKLELYNSRSGAIVSAFQYPIEMLAGILLSVVILTFATRFVLVSNPSYETRLGIMIASFGMAYVLTTGLSALNIELVNEIPVVRMNATDLVARNVLAEELVTASGYNRSSPERTRQNHITNTVLRTATRPYQMRPPAICTNAPKNFTPSPVTATFGFRQSTWQSEVFVQALDEELDTNSSYKIYMNTTKHKEMAANQSVKMPMDLELARNLFTNSLMFGYSWVKWWTIGVNYSQVMEDKFSERFGNRSMKEIERNPRMLTATDLYDLAPPANSNVDPLDWFVNRTRAMLDEALAPQINASFIASSIKFKTLKLSDEVTMDSITYELPMWKGYLDRKLQADSTDTRLVSTGLNHSAVQGRDKRTAEWEAEQESRTVYYEINTRDDCGPSVPACLVESNEFADGAPIAPEHRMRAIGICLNANGTEELQFTEKLGQRPGPGDQPTTVLRMPACTDKSTNSFHISGFSYRIVGDAMINSPLPNIDPDEPTELTRQRAVLVNPRKIYSFTVARISWKTAQLADKFNVNCDENSTCDGLSFALQRKGAGPRQHLVVGMERLPVHSLQPYAYEEPFYHVQYVSGVPLLATPIMLNVVGSKFVDYALSHNFKTIKWANDTMRGDNCSFYAERGLVTNVDNHYYMEGTVQPVYTAAFFFLFQEATIRDEITDHRVHAAMLKTNNVVIPVDVNVSIPDKNSIVTVCGCFLLMASCIGVWYSYHRSPDLLEQSLPADTTVQVLMNNGTYPSFLLQKTVMTADKGRVIGEGNGVVIERVGLRGQQEPPV